MALADPTILEYTLSPPDRRVLDAFAAAVRAHFADRVERIAVFGSRARGDVHGDSDIDVVVLLRVPITDETNADTIVRRMLDDAWRREPEHYVPISVIVMAAERFQAILTRERRFPSTSSGRGSECDGGASQGEHRRRARRVASCAGHGGHQRRCG